MKVNKKVRPYTGRLFILSTKTLRMGTVGDENKVCKNLFEHKRLDAKVYMAVLACLPLQCLFRKHPIE